MLRHRRQIQDGHVVQRGDIVNAFQIRPHRAGTHVKKDARRGQQTAGHLHGMRRGETRLPHNHFGCFQPAHRLFNALARLLDQLVLARLDAGHVDLDIASTEAKFIAAPRLMNGPRAGHHGFGRGTADIDAGAPKSTPLDKRCFQPLFAAARGQRWPRLASTNDDHVKRFRGHGR